MSERGSSGSSRGPDRRAAGGAPAVGVVAGIDGCRGGWLCVSRDLATERYEGCILSSIEEVRALRPTPDILLIDIPIGLLPSGSRDCDREARRLLGMPRSSSVFPAPLRPVLDAAEYAEACAIRLRIEGKSMGRQAWGIVGKVREVDAFLRSSPGAGLREVHPEVSFWLWSSQRPMRHGKKTRDGRAEREKLLTSSMRQAYARLQSSLPRGLTANDDLLDAFAACWSAERVRAGRAMTLPSAPPRDQYGLLMEIVV